MALVAYDVSDESNDEEENQVEVETIASSFTSTTKNGSIPVNSSRLNLPLDLGTVTTYRKPSPPSDEEDEDDDSIDIAPPSFSKLPKPNYHALGVDESKMKNCKLRSLSKLLPISTRSKGPSMKMKKATVQTCEKGSGLLSMLPNPVNGLDSIPVQNSSETPSVSKLPAKMLPTAVKNAAAKKEKTKKSTVDNESDDEEIGADFFSLSKVDSIEDLPEPIDIDFNLEVNDIADSIKPEKPTNLNSFSAGILQSNSAVSSSNDQYYDQDSPEDDMELQSQVDLDEDAIQKLCGRKRKGQFPDDIQVIDIHEDKILAESKKNLAKQLTEEVTYRPSHKKHHGPSSLEKRKHQITYLAYQAKERELELKNQWASNRFTKKQTQSKYGF